MAKPLKVLLPLAALVVIAGGIYAYAHSKGGSDNGLKLVEATVGSVTEKAVAVGQIQPRQKFQVKSKISGIVKRAMVEVGDTVLTGAALFEIAPDPTPFELTEVGRSLESARASFTRAKADFDRVAELERTGVVPRSDLEARREAYELARIALLRAEQNSDLTIRGRVQGGGAAMESILRAPADGTVLSRAVNPGDPVVPLTSYQPGTELATIADMRDLIFKGTVDEIDVGKLKVGLLTRIKVGALPTDVVTGKVARIAPQAQQKEGATLFDVEIELDPVPGLTLRAGYSANADIIIREKNDVITIPERLVIFEDGGKKTFVELPAAEPRGEPRKVEVKLGISDGLNVEVVSGVERGASIVQRPPKEIS
jgi:HlyD family secretion protein